MSAMTALVEILMNINPFYVAAGAIAQQVFAMAWFGCIVHHMDSYYLAADKGVRRVEHAICRYSTFIIAAISFLCAASRSVAVMVVAQVFKATTLVDYEYAAVVVALLSMLSVYRSFACQRPVQLIVTEGVFEIAAAMIAAVVYYFMTTYKV